MNSPTRAKPHKCFFTGLAHALAGRWQHWKSAFGPDHYHPEKHYMRGPGPKAKRRGGAGDNKTPGPA
jgi:hypothetical protein